MEGHVNISLGMKTSFICMADSYQQLKEYKYSEKQLIRLHFQLAEILPFQGGVSITHMSS